MDNRLEQSPAVVTLTRRSLWIAGGVTLAAVGALAAALTLHRGPQAEPATRPTLLTEGPAPDDGTPPKAVTPPSSERSAPAAKAVAKTPAPAAICAACGVVEAVQTVKTEGHASGVGAVAGGVIGGVLGNQVGGGNGRKAMTVLGAVGGGIAGNEIEKSRNATTVWRVTVRKDDGTRVTLTRHEPWSVGTRVRVDGETLRAA